jgi:hypothetical protein
MPLIVAPLDGFDSYVSVAQADAYLAAVGKADWQALADAVKETHIRVGSIYVGARKLKSVYVTPVVHGNIAAATCEAAYRSWKGTLYADSPSQAVKSVTVGPIKREYADVANNGQPRFGIIEDLLSGMTSRGLLTSATFERA